MRKIFAVLILAVVSGCDFGDSAAERELAYRIEKDKQERLQRDKEVKAEAMRKYLDGRCKIVQEKLRRVTGDLQALRHDSEMLEKEIEKERQSLGNDESVYENVLLMSLRNKNINALAVKYLSEGFALHAEKLVKQVRLARASERKFEAALKQSERQYEKSIEESNDWVSGSKSQRDAEIHRLEREIAELEKMRKATLRDTRGDIVPSRANRAEWVGKMRDFEGQIYQKRRQIDYLRNPDVNKNIETRAVYRIQQVQRTAGRIKEDRDYDIYRRLKPEKSVAEVVEETTAETIEKLRKEMKTRIGKMTEEEKNLSGKMETAREIIIAIPVSELSELNRLKVKADREL